MLPFLIPAYLLLALTLTLPPPTITTASTPKTPLLNLNFPDPCIIQDPSSGTWYAFATGSWAPNTSATGTSSDEKSTWKNIQAASAPSPRGPWTYLSDTDPLPEPGPWTAVGESPSPQVWAPSVVHLSASRSSSSSPSSDTVTKTTNSTIDSESYVLYYAAQLAGNNSAFHCIGAATSSTILGPYTPLPEPIVCPLEQGGAIDPAGFVDNHHRTSNGTGDGDQEGEGEKGTKGRRYLLYKVDGNARGNGGDCGNGIDPIRATPLMLQEVDPADEVSLIGEAVEVLDRDLGGGDGPLVEAPELVFYPPSRSNGCDGSEGETEGEGRYVLFYSNHCWVGPGYSVNYAVARDIRGPYERKGEGPLIRTGDGFNITAPGGAASVPGGGWLLFHGDCPAGRCLFGAETAFEGGRVAVW